MNTFLKFTGIAVGLLIIAVLVVPSFVDWNRYKSEIAKPIQELTGRKLEIDGDVNFALLPSPVFSAHGLRLANIDGGVATSLASVESLEINVAFMPLLGGRVDVTSLVLNQPVVALEILADGRSNWALAGTGKTSRQNSVTQQSVKAGPPIDISFSEVAIANGVVSYFDGATGNTHRLNKVDTKISASSLEGPYSAKGKAEAVELPVQFELLIGNLTSSRAVPISFSVAVGETGAKATFAGWANELTRDARFNGRLTLEGENLATAVGDVAAMIGSDMMPPLNRSDEAAQAFSGEAQVVASVQELRIRSLSMQLGESLVTGGFQAGIDGGKVFDGKLEISSIDLDRWLAPSDGALENKKPEAEPVAADTTAGTAVDTVKEDPDTSFQLPEDISGTFGFSVGALSYHGGVARQIGATIRVGEGRIGLESAKALLPGGSAVDLTGVLVPRDGKPQFRGQVKASSDNLRGLLSWLDIDVESVPADRLTRLALTSSIDLSPDVVQAYGMDVTLDAMKVTGGVSIALQDRAAFGVELSVNELNLDAYFPPTEAIDETGKSPNPAGSGGMAGLKSAVADLDDLDANVRIDIGKVTWNEHFAEKVLLDGVLFGGELTLKTASVGNVQGATLSLSGNANGFSQKPTVDGVLDFDFRQKTALESLWGQPLPYPVSNLGPGKGSLEIKGNDDRVTIDMSGKFTGTQVALKGGIVAPTASPRVDLNLDVTNGSLARLIKQFELPIEAPERPDDGPLSLTFAATGNLDALQLRLKARAAGGDFSIAGRVHQIIAKPDYVFDLDLKSSDLTKFVRGLGNDFQPSSANLGGVSMSVAVRGGNTEATVSSIKGNVGPVDFEGDARVILTGDRPHVEGSLELSEVIADLFLSEPTDGAPGAGGRQAGSERGEAWSLDPINVSYLRDFNSDLKIKSPKISFGAYEFQNLNTTIKIENGIASVAPLKARLFEGEAELTVVIDAQSTPALNLDIALTNADIAKTVAAATGLQVVTGRAGFKGEFRSTGISQRELISNLVGGLRFSAREGAIKGIDLPQLSQRLNNINEIKDVLGVVTGPLSGGQTLYRSVEGAVQVEGGVARTTDVSADIDAVDATIVSELDLVNWSMDTQTSFALTEHPKAPSLGIDFYGPIDDPARNLRTRALESYLTQKVANALLKKLIKPQSGATNPSGTPATEGGATGVTPLDETPADSTPAPSNAPPPITPEDILRGVLQNLP